MAGRTIYPSMPVRRPGCGRVLLVLGTYLVVLVVLLLVPSLILTWVLRAFDHDIPVWACFAGLTAVGVVVAAILD